MDEQGASLQTVESKYPVTEKDFPGFRFFTGVKKLENYQKNLIARFPFKDENSNNLYMQALIGGNENRHYY